MTFGVQFYPGYKVHFTLDALRGMGREDLADQLLTMAEATSSETVTDK